VRPPCVFSADQVRFDHPLPRMARRLTARLPIRIVALGSSSTGGAGASSPSASYPSRLEAELRRHFPGHEIAVLNRGINGDEAPGMLARLATDVIAERPEVVLWQLGTNAVLRDDPLGPFRSLLHEGIARLRGIGADIVLIDPQFAPEVIGKANCDAMVELIATAAKEERVDLFRRFALMRRWRVVQGLPFDVFLSPDDLHMNDWSYACFARALGAGIAEAASRPPSAA